MKDKIREKIRRRAAVIMIGVFMLTGAMNAFAAASDLIPVDIDIATDTSTQSSMEVEVFWSDEWFAEPSTEYNHELGITSIALSGTAYLEQASMSDAESPMRRALLDFGFDADSIRMFNYDYPYTPQDNDVVAFTLAAKDTENGPLIAVIIRGTLEELEWQSDLRISAYPSGYDEAVEHYGYYQAAGKLSADLEKYLDDLGGFNTDFMRENLKFYVTGHSRGGSTADILAAALDDTYGKERVYAYTFAAPAVSAYAGETGYENIFNITSSEDIVPQLDISKQNFKRFGVDMFMTGGSQSESQDDDVFMAHNPFVYYARMKSSLPDTLFE